MLLGKVEAKSIVVNHRHAKNGKRIATSYVSIRAGDVVIAQATLGGSWSPEQVMKEYIRLPKRFKQLVQADAGEVA